MRYFKSPAGFYLSSELGYDNVRLKRGERSHHIGSTRIPSHTWLVVNGSHIVDITGDQFHDCDHEVIVTTNSTFHETFGNLNEYTLEDEAINNEQSKIYLTMNERMNTGE